MLKKIIILFCFFSLSLFASNKDLSVNTSYLFNNKPEADISFYFPVKFFSIGGDFSFLTDLNEEYPYQNYTFALNEKFAYKNIFAFYIGIGIDYLPNPISSLMSFFISTKIHYSFYIDRFFWGFNIDNFHFSNGINSYIRGFSGYKFNFFYLKLGYMGFLSFTPDSSLNYYNGLFAGIEYEF